MTNIVIRKYQKEDENDILKICYKTGYMGEDLTYLNKFNDIKLFGYLFCLYYIWYEAKNCFVAFDKDTGKAAGYIIGTTDSKYQEKDFMRKMSLPIIRRFFSITLWKYPESVNAIFYFMVNMRLNSAPAYINKEYPAHLHINILPEYQHMGIGSMLVSKFEEHVYDLGIKGIHLSTSNKNIKALPFYINRGYSVIYERKEKVWRGIKDYKGLILAKKLDN